MKTDTGLKTLNVTRKENYLIVQLDRGKANVLNQEMIDELRELIQVEEENEETGGIILNGKPHFFSGGVDLLEVYYYDSEAIRNFWGSFIELSSEMLAFSKPMIAAITGHSPAGGCILASVCDYRVMTKGEQYKIGLNEIAVGIAPRQSILHLYASLIGKRKAYQYLLEGHLMSPSEAFDVGLVDELSEMEDTLKRAEAKMQQYLSLPGKAFRQTKRALREELIAQMRHNHVADLDLLHKQLMSEESRAIMGKVVEFLKSRK